MNTTMFIFSKKKNSVRQCLSFSECIFTLYIAVNRIYNDNAVVSSGL